MMVAGLRMKSKGLLMMVAGLRMKSKGLRMMVAGLRMKSEGLRMMVGGQEWNQLRCDCPDAPPVALAGSPALQIRVMRKDERGSGFPPG